MAQNVAITQPQSFLLKSVAESSLPSRSQMKAGKQYWIDLPLFTAIPSRSHPLKAMSMVAKLLLKSKFKLRKNQLKCSSLCIFLGNDNAKA